MAEQVKNQEPVSDTASTNFCALDFTVDKNSDVPPYSQLRRAIIALRANGTLSAGDRLPPMRILAEKLGLAVNTVAKAYKELEAAGAIETNGRAGSFITATDMTAQRKHELASTYVLAMRKMGIEDEDILAACQHELGLKN